MQKFALLVLFCSAMFCLSGCVVSLPVETLSSSIDSGELAEHVDFLCQPALKGRKAKSWEAATVRQYLAARFDLYGLKPWPGEESYEQEFIFGTHMIGVMEGSDPDLANEIVILSAHYDHIGTGRKGIYPGACDNAAGVAVLLEIAERMALQETRPKRTVAFASFDAEEKRAIGAFAFTSSESFAGKKIAAVVNVDLLGRDFLDIIENSLFVAGTENYPQLRSAILEKSIDTDLKLLPLATELTGPTGDHVAFEYLDIPVLFFSSGFNKDYHQPTDTPEKLDYEAIRQSALLIEHATMLLANSTPQRVEQTESDDAQLEALAYIAKIAGNNAGQIVLDDEQAAKLLDLADEARTAVAQKNLSQSDQHYLGVKIVSALGAAIEANNLMFKGTTGLSSWQLAIYADHSPFLISSYRDIVEHIVRKKPGLFDNLNFKNKVYDIMDRNISLVQNEDGLYQLDILMPQIGFNLITKGIIFKSGHLSISAKWSSLFMEGTKQQLVDYCLLQMQKDLEDSSYAQSWTKILNTLTDTQGPTDYRAWLRWWIEKRQFDSEQQWLEHLVGQEHPQLEVSAIYLKSPEEFCKLIEDPNTPAVTRHLAINLIRENATRKQLLSLAKVVDDETPLSTGNNKRYWPLIMEWDYPFAEHLSVRLLKDNLNKNTDSKKTEKVLKTIGDFSEHILTNMTGKDFGRKKEKWQKWIKANVKDKLTAKHAAFATTSVRLKK